jgi:IPT/TIG domain
MVVWLDALKFMENMGRKIAVCLPLAVAAVLLAATSLFVAGPALQSSSPTVTLSPATALPNQSIIVTGKGFTTGGGTKVSSIAIGVSLIPVEKINFGSAVDVDNGGNFVANVVIPLNSATLTPGSYSVEATDSAGVKASTSLTIPTPTLSVSPTSSRVGSTVTATGANFPINNGGFGADNTPAITIEYEVNGGTSRSVVTVFPDSSGGFTATFTVPVDAPVPSSDNIVRALISGASAAATTKHSVPNPILTPSPAKGAPGTEVTLTGSDFKAFATVTSLTLGGLDVVDLSGLHTDAIGGFTITFVVPETYGGAQPVSVEVGGSRYTTVFHVEAGFTGPALPPESISLASSLWPMEDNLVRVFYFDNATKKWAFYDPRPAFARASTLTELVEGRAYWIEVKTDQTAILGSRVIPFTEGWNLISW